MYLLLIFLPLISFLFVNFFGFILGKKLSFLIILMSMVLTFFFSLIIFYEVGLNKSVCHIILWKYIEIVENSIEIGFKIDSLTVIMYLVVNTVSLMVHLYSKEYMEGEVNSVRFMSYLSLFSFFMLVLVSGKNLMVIFIGWEGVGICSYLLINYWNTRINANKSAIKAVVINRIGDLFFIMGMVLSVNYFSSLDIEIINGMVLELIKEEKIIGVTKIDIICIFFVLASMGKSAQLFLHMWLADAMEGPTPVSALIHAATMVTAGVFLIIRMSYLFEQSEIARNIIEIVGLITLLFGGLIGYYQNDLKRVIAYSTCSQLGYMIYACGGSNYDIAIYHLFNHAFFKALLFLIAGVIIHKLGDEQDMRKMGGLKKEIKLTYIYMLVGLCALMGVPFFSGYYSKDLIIELAYMEGKKNEIALIILIISAIITIMYSMLIILMVFEREKIYLIKEKKIKKIKEFGKYEGISLGVLFLGSIISGYIFREMEIGIGVDFWNGSIYQINNELIDKEIIPIKIKLILFLLVLFLVLIIQKLKIINIENESKIFFEKIKKKEKKKDNSYKIYEFLINKMYFDELINKYIINNIMNYGYENSYLLIDEGWIQKVMGEETSINIFKKVKKIKENITHSENKIIIGRFVSIIVGILIYFVIVYANYK